MDKKAIDEKIINLQTLQTLAKVYAEISSTRMLKVRGEVLSTRDFLGAIDTIFQEVRSSYQREVLKLAKKKGAKGQKPLTFLAHNGKTVAVFVSANTGLYGDIIQRTFRLFSEEFKKGNIEATIIGKLGLSLFLEKFRGKPFTYFDFPDYGVNREALGEIVRHLVQYEEIHAYYGRYQSIINQVPVSLNISAKTSEELGGAQEKTKTKYLFEPSLEDILIFFETEMFTSVFEQALSEGQLAKFAARMLAMDQASQNVVSSLKMAHLEKNKINHAIANRKQLNLLPAIISYGR